MPLKLTALALLGDLGIKTSGAALVVVCGGLPFYVALNGDSFGPPEMAFDGVTATFAEKEDRVSRFAWMAKSKDVYVVDELTTASTRSSDRPLAERMDLPSAPVFDSGSDLLAEASASPAESAEGDVPPPMQVAVVAAADGIAIIEQGSSTRLVQPGSVLSDGSVVTSIANEAGQWVIKARSRGNAQPFGRKPSL